MAKLVRIIEMLGFATVKKGYTTGTSPDADASILIRKELFARRA